MRGAGSVQPASDKFVMSVPGLVVGFLLIAVLIPSTYGDGPDACVSTFHEFEKVAISESPGNVAALVSAFYPTNKPVPLSVQVVYRVNSSNGVDNDTFISTDPNCPAGKEMWLWVPSPVFLFMEPTKLNWCAMLTLNYFQPWSPHRVHIHVPNICNISQKQFNFLNDFTSRVQIYAAAHLYDKDINQAYVLRGCGDEALSTLLPTTLRNNDQSLEILSEVLMCIYLFGCLCLIVVVLLVIWWLLHENVTMAHETVAGYQSIIANLSSTGPDQLQQPSMNKYGLFWAGVVLSVLGNIVLIGHAIVIVYIYTSSRANNLILMGGIIGALMVIGTLGSLIVAFWFGRKLNLSIPSVFLHHLVIIKLCPAGSCAVQTSKKITQCLSLWSIILFLLHVFGRIGIIALALLASPPTVLFTLLIYLVAAACSVQFLAVVFTFCKMTKSQQKCYSFVQTLAFTCLFLAILCFSVMISAIGALADYGTVTSSLYSVFSIFVASMAPTAFVWALHKIGRMWLNASQE